MLELIFLFSAVAGGTIMLCQFALTLIGGGHDDGGGDGPDSSFDGDFDDAGGDHTGHGHHHDNNWLFKALSLRTLVAAIAFFGAAGMAASSAGVPRAGSLAIALLTGVAAMYGVYWLMVAIGRLTSSGNENIDNALGCPATVYIPVPASRRGAGKVQLTVQNRIVEYQAVTDDELPLRTGEVVRVLAVSGDDLVCVGRIAEPAPVEA